MKHSKWNKQCPYAAFYSCAYPAIYGQYQYYMPCIDDFYTAHNETRDSEADSESLSRAQRDVERVLPIVFQSVASEINQAIALGMSPNLVSYLIREMVQYIDRNFDQYGKSASNNITQASEGIKTNLYWIYNIFRVYGVPFEVYIRLLNNVVITSMRALRNPSYTIPAPTTR